MSDKKKKTDNVVCMYRQEDARTEITVECSFDHVESTGHDMMEMQLPGADELATMTQGPERTEVSNERVMVEIKVRGKGEHGGGLQTLVLAAEDFQSVAEAVGKVLPGRVEPRYAPAPYGPY